MFKAETLALAAVLALAAQVLVNSMWTPRLLVSGLRIYSRDLSLGSPMTIREIDAEIAKLKSPRFAHRVISGSQIGIRRQPTYVSVTGVHGLITLSKGARFEALLSWPGFFFYVLILAFYSMQVDFSLGKIIVPTLVVILLPFGEAARIGHAVSQLESRQNG